MSNFRRRLMMSIKKSELPRGYTELEYLESTGTQYIQIYSINEKDTYELESNINFTIRNSRQAFGNVQARYLEINVNGYYGMGGGITSNAKATSGFDNIKLKIMSNKSQIILDNNVIAERTPINLNNFNKIYLFGLEPSSFKSLNCKMRMTTTILKHNNNVVRNLIPCLDNNNEPCMYDTISKQAFYNQGTGEFLYKEKSLFNTSNLQIGYAISANGVINANSNFNCTEFIPVNQSKYIFSGISGKKSDWNLRIHAYDENKNWIKQILMQPISVGKTLDVNFEINDDTIKYIRVSIANENFTDYDLITLKEIS